MEGKKGAHKKHHKQGNKICVRIMPKQVKLYEWQKKTGEVEEKSDF